MFRVRNDADSKYVLQIIIQEGCRFPRKSQCGFVLQSVLLGVPQTTTAVFNAPSGEPDRMLCPAWNETFEWELSGQDIHRLRSERVQLKIELFSTDKSLKQLDSMGHILVDIRSIPEGNKALRNPGKWHALTKSTSHLRPEVFLTCRISDRSRGVTFQEPSKSHSTPTRTSNPQYPNTKPSHNRVHNQSQSTYASSHAFNHVREGHHASEQSNTEPLSYDPPIHEKQRPIQEFMKAPSTSSGMHRPHKSNRDNGAESDSEHNSQATTSLHSGRKSSARSHTSTRTTSNDGHEVNMARNNASDDEDEDSAYEETTEISHHSDKDFEDEGSEDEEDDSRLSDKIPKQNMATKSDPDSGNYGEDDFEPEEHSRPASNRSVTNTNPRQETRVSPLNLEKINDNQSSNEKSKGKQISGPRLNTGYQKKTTSSHSQRNSKPHNHPISLKTSSFHHYRLTIDFQKFMSVSLSGGGTRKVFAKYRYPQLGIPGPVLTLPPVSIPANSRPDAEFSIMNGFTNFEFSMEPRALASIFQKQPMVAEVWHRGDAESDEKIGVCYLDLGQVLAAPVVIAEAKRFAHPIQAVSLIGRVVEVLPDENETQRARVLVVITLEDLGQMPDTTNASQPSAVIDTHMGAASADVNTFDLRKTPEYTTAWELEMWRKSEEVKWIQELKLKEESHIRALSDEWAKRENERAAIVKKAKEDYGRLEDQLREALANIEVREKKLRQSEDDLTRQKELFAKEKSEQEEALRKSARSMQEEFNRLLGLQKQETNQRDAEIAHLMERIQAMKNDLEAADERTRSVYREFESYRLQQTKTPEGVLQSESQKLKLRVAELEKALTDSQQSKENYKVQLTRALKEISRLRRAQQNSLEERLEQERKQVEKMKAKCSALEQKSMLQSESQQLASLRKELDDLKTRPIPNAWGRDENLCNYAPVARGDMLAVPLQVSHTLSQNAFYQAMPISVPVPNPSPGLLVEDSRQKKFRELDIEMQRLTCERDELLATSFYNEDDALIVTLNSRIIQISAQLKQLYVDS